jgi:hypothetical protein
MGFPRWRKMTWAIIVWCVLILVWMVGGAASNECGQERTDLNQSACEAGTGIGVALVGFLGFLGFVFLSLIWFMTRPKGRECPVCGEDVKKGNTTCPNCNHDFATIARASAASTAQAPAGWYPQPSGEQRYWDGTAWTERTAPAGQPPPAVSGGDS